MMAAREAKESAEIPASTVSIDASAANLAQATEGSVVIKADPEDIFPMDIPNSPMEMQREWIRSQLDELPEGSSVTIPVEQYRNMVIRASS